MKFYRFNFMSKFAGFIFLLLLLSSCARSSPPAPPPIQETNTVVPTASPTPTEIPLPKEPTLLSIIGKGKVNSTLWSPDHQVFAVSASDAIRVYQGETHQVLAEFPPQDWARLQFSPDGQKLAVIAVANDLLIYDLQTRQKVSQVTAGTSLKDFAFNADGSGFALSKHFYHNYADPGVSWVEVYDLNSNKPRYQFDFNLNPEVQTTTREHYYQDVVFCPDGRWLSAADQETGQVRTWDLATGQLSALRLAHPFVTVLACAPDGHWLASGGGDNQVRIWNSTSGHLFRTLTGFTKTISSLTFSADSTQLTVETGDSLGSTTETFDIDTGQKLDIPAVPTTPDEIQAFLVSEGYLAMNGSPQFSPDRRTLSFLNGNQVVLWDLVAQRQQAVLDTKNGSAVAFQPDGKMLAVIQSDGSVDLWDIASRQREKNLPSRKAMTMAFSADGNLLAIGGRQAVELWDIQSGRQLWQYYASGLWIQAVEFSQDGQTVTAAASSGWAVLWLSTENGQLQQTFHPNSFDPGSTTIALQRHLLATIKPVDSGPGAIRIWDLREGQVLKDISSFQPDLYGNDFTFSSDGRMIAGQGKGNAKIWSTVTGQTLFEFPEGVHAPIFSPNQQFMALSDDLGRIQIWDTQSLLQRAPELPIQPSGLLPTLTPAAVVSQVESHVQPSCLNVQPTLSPERKLTGQLVMGAFPSYLLDLNTGKRRLLPNNFNDISTSPNGEWLFYRIRPGNQTEKDWLVFEDPAGVQRKYPMQADWLFPAWLGNDLFSYNFRVDISSSVRFSPTQIISPVSGPGQQLPSQYPGMQPFSGMSGSPYHFGGSNVIYDPTLRLVIYEKTGAKYDDTSLVLYDRQNGKELVSLPDYSGEHYWNNPIWSADGQFFIAALIKDYQPGSKTAQEEWFRVYRDGSIEQLTHLSNSNDQIGRWGAKLAPNGRMLGFYLTNKISQIQSVAVLDLDTKVITNTCLRGGSLTWSPDSHYLVVYEEYEQNAARTILIDLAHWQAEQIVDDNHAVPAGWLKAP